MTHIYYGSRTFFFSSSHVEFYHTVNLNRSRLSAVMKTADFKRNKCLNWMFG